MFKTKIREALNLALKGADINAMDSFPYSPLHYAVKGDGVEMAELLINAGANVNAQGHNTTYRYDSRTPLALAIKSYATNVETLLRQHGAVEG